MGTVLRSCWEFDRGGPGRVRHGTSEGAGHLTRPPALRSFSSLAPRDRIKTDTRSLPAASCYEQRCAGMLVLAANPARRRHRSRRKEVEPGTGPDNRPGEGGDKDRTHDRRRRALQASLWQADRRDPRRRDHADELYSFSEATKAQAPHPHPPKDSDAHPPQPTTRTPRLAALLLSLFQMFAEAVASFPPMPADAGTLLRRPALPQAQNSATGRPCFFATPPWSHDGEHTDDFAAIPTWPSPSREPPDYAKPRLRRCGFRPGLSFLDLLAPAARAHAC